MKRDGFPRARPPVYLFPCRIQEGWGDVAEFSRVAWALYRAGFPLVGEDPGRGRGRMDPRVVPLDPREAGPVVPFPPLHPPRDVPLRGRAILLATWWGLSCRTEDDEGDPVPGPWASSVTSVIRHRTPEEVLTVSLEEFGSAVPSRTFLSRQLATAGWSPGRVLRYMGSPQGKEHLFRYVSAFRRYRGASSPTTLHVVSQFAPDPEAAREFPFLVQTGPAEGSPRHKEPARVPESGPLRVLWYASPPSSRDFAPPLFAALSSLGRPVDLVLRTRDPELTEGDPGPSRGSLRVIPAPELPPEAWDRLEAEAHLRIVSGSQSLVEALEDRAPFLYFNGWVRTPSGKGRPFRTEKLLSLLSARGRSPAARSVNRDLWSFAGGRDLRAILRRALLSPAWRAEVVRRAPSRFPPRYRDMGAYVVEVARSFSREAIPSPALVARERAHASGRIRSLRPPVSRTLM